MTESKLRKPASQMPKIHMPVLHLPNGFRYGSAACGIKQEGNDVGLIMAETNCIAAGVYTTNLVRAACIDQNKSKTPSNKLRAVFVNSGNANACTGPTGEENSLAIAKNVAQVIGCTAEQVLVLSTGVIGQQLPMENIFSGIEAAVGSFDSSTSSVSDLCQAFMTTDRFPKIVSQEFKIEGSNYRMLGIAKGAGMIGPNMATMLAVFVTDAPIASDAVGQMLATAVNQSFNRISVEGHTSTNDAVLLLSSANPNDEVTANASAVVQDILNESCIELAKMIPTDGEGATHLIEIKITGAPNDDDADQIARVIAASNLVKTAVSGCDPNWGRIVSAAGYAKVDIKADEISLKINGTTIFQQGTPVEFDEFSLSQAMIEPNVLLELSVGSATGQSVHWTSDLTVDYVNLNADYRT